MSEPFDSQPDDATQNDNLPVAKTSESLPETPPAHLKLVASGKPKKKASKASASSLKLVTSAAVSDPVHKSPPSQRHYFTAEVRKRSPDDFVMVAQDPFHFLSCELPLKFDKREESKKAPVSLVCHFPTIGDDELVDFIEEDEDLLGVVMISFHMQILKNLFMFCAAHKATNLILKTTEDQFSQLGIYEEFIKYVDKIPTKKGMDIEATIPAPYDACAACGQAIDIITEQFRQTLWQEQSSNAAIRAYLKSNVRFSIVA